MKRKTQAEKKEDLDQLVVDVAQGNVGCATACAELLKLDPLTGWVQLTFLRQQKTLAPHIWLFYKDVHQKDIRKFSEGLNDFFSKEEYHCLTEYMIAKELVPRHWLGV